MLTPEDIERLIGGTAFDIHDDRVGHISMIFLDDSTGEPAWATINTGLFGGHGSFVPLDGAVVNDHDIRIAFTKDRVRDAPRIHADSHLDLAQEHELYRHYGLEPGSASSATSDDER